MLLCLLRMDMGMSHVTEHQQGVDSVLLLLTGSALTVLVLSLHAWDEVSDAEVLDHLLQDSVVASIDAVDLNLGALGNEIHLSLALFLLETKRDTSDGSLLNSLHQVSGETSNLVTESLCLDLADVIDDSLVDMEVVGQPTRHERQKTRQNVKLSSNLTNVYLLAIVLFDECPGGSLDGLGSNSSLYAAEAETADGYLKIILQSG